MSKVLNYFNNRKKAWRDYYHLKKMPDRLLEDIGIERSELAQIRRSRPIRRGEAS